MLKIKLELDPNSTEDLKEANDFLKKLGAAGGTKSDEKAPVKDKPKPGRETEKAAGKKGKKAEVEEDEDLDDLDDEDEEDVKKPSKKDKKKSSKDEDDEDDDSEDAGDEDEEDDSAPSTDDLVKVARELVMDWEGQAEAKKIFKKYGAAQAKDVKKDKIGACIKELKRAIADKKAASETDDEDEEDDE